MLLASERGPLHHRGATFVVDGRVTAGRLLNDLRPKLEPSGLFSKLRAQRCAKIVGLSCSICGKTINSAWARLFLMQGECTIHG